MREIDELLELCRYAGSSLAIGQGAGGNASVKTADGVMWIKASGYRLSAVCEGHGYLPMRTPEPAGLARSVAGRDARTANASMSAYLQSLALDSTDMRPSLETWFHAVLGRAVLHTHPIYANAFSCMEGGREELERLLTEPPVYVEYATPGHQLGEAVQRAVQGKAAAQILLENHGLIASAHSTWEAIALSEEVLSAGQAFFGPLDEHSFELGKPSAELNSWAARLERACAGSVARAARFECLRGAVTGPLPLPLVPDDVVCNGATIFEARRGEWPEEFVARQRGAIGASAAILVGDLGYVFLARTEAMISAMEEQLLANTLVRELVSRRGVCRPLPRREMSALPAMDSEKHRQAVLAWGGASCR